MRLKKTIFSACLLLAGCAAPPTSYPAAVHHYTPAQEKQIAAEHNALPQDDVLRTVLQEWENLRRVCP